MNGYGSKNNEEGPEDVLDPKINLDIKIKLLQLLKHFMELGSAQLLKKQKNKMRKQDYSSDDGEENGSKFTVN